MKIWCGQLSGDKKAAVKPRCESELGKPCLLLSKSRQSEATSLKMFTKETFLGLDFVGHSLPGVGSNYDLILNIIEQVLEPPVSIKRVIV